MSTETSPNIIVYSTAWCGFCRSLKQYLDSKNIAHIDKDVEADEAAYKELMGKIGGNYQGVPVTDINGQIILGFDRPKIDATLNAHNITS